MGKPFTPVEFVEEKPILNEVSIEVDVEKLYTSEEEDDQEVANRQLQFEGLIADDPEKSSSSSLAISEKK